MIFGLDLWWDIERFCCDVCIKNKTSYDALLVVVLFISSARISNMFLLDDLVKGFIVKNVMCVLFMICSVSLDNLMWSFDMKFWCKKIRLRQSGVICEFDMVE